MKPIANLAAFVGAVVLYIVLVGGCGGARDQLQKGLEGTRDFVEVAKPCLVAAQDKAEADCKGDAACVAKVQEAFEPAAVGLQAFHDLWCAMSPESEGCK